MPLSLARREYTLPKDDQGRWSLAGYKPSLALAIVATVIYVLLCGVFWYRWARSSRPRYMLVLCIGATSMMLGYALRIGYTFVTYNIGLYIMTILLVLLSPCLFIAQDYMLLPRLATRLRAEDGLFLRSSRIVRIFVWSDFLTFQLQGDGGGLTASNTERTRTIGFWVRLPQFRKAANADVQLALVGLAAQLVSFLLFTALAGVWYVRARRRGDLRLDTRGLGWKRDWRYLFGAMVFSCVFVLLRSAYRTAEYAQGYGGYLSTHEVYFYALDGLPVLLAVAPYAVLWPPSYLSDLDGCGDGELETDIEMEGAVTARLAGKTPAVQH